MYNYIIAKFTTFGKRVMVWLFTNSLYSMHNTVPYTEENIMKIEKVQLVTTDFMHFGLGDQFELIPAGGSFHLSQVPESIVGSVWSDTSWRPERHEAFNTRTMSQERRAELFALLKFKFVHLQSRPNTGREPKRMVGGPVVGDFIEISLVTDKESGPIYAGKILEATAEASLGLPYFRAKTIVKVPLGKPSLM